MRYVLIPLSLIGFTQTMKRSHNDSFFDSFDNNDF